MCRILVDRLEETSFCLVNKSCDAGASTGRYPIRFNRLYNRSIVALSFSAVMAHHEGTAYISHAIVVHVALVTECRASSRRPWALSTRRAISEREHTESRFSA